MFIISSKRFDKQFSKQSIRIKKEFDIRIRIFMENHRHPILNTHRLAGKLRGLSSFNITGDIRVVFKEEGDHVILVNIGTHSELYS